MTLVGYFLAHKKANFVSGVGYFRWSWHGKVIEISILTSLSVWGSDMTCGALCAHRCGDSCVASVT